MTGTASTEANGVPQDLQARGGADPDQPADGPQGPATTSSTRPRTRSSRRSIDDIAERHEAGQPVLVGTISVEMSELLSSLLERKRHPAQGAERQAARARGADRRRGRPAGRGHDRHQHGRPRHRHQAGRGRARTLGGLYVLGTERHESRRIDNQLRGRSGRQGDPGETRFFLSAEDELVRLFAGDRIYTILDKLGPDEGEPIEAQDADASASRAPRSASRSATSRSARTCSSTTTC